MVHAGFRLCWTPAFGCDQLDGAPGRSFIAVLPSEKFAVQPPPAHEGPHRRLGVMSAAYEADTRHYIVVVSYIAKSFSRSLPTRPVQVVEDAG